MLQRRGEILSANRRLPGVPPSLHRHVVFKAHHVPKNKWLARLGPAFDEPSTARYQGLADTWRESPKARVGIATDKLVHQWPMTGE